MRQRLLMSLFLTAVLLSVNGQPPETIYQGSVAKEGYVNNAFYGPFSIGFNFTFYGNTYTEFYVSSNGLVTFGAGSADATEDPIPTAATPNNFIAPFWDDLAIDPLGSILYTTIGAAPNRKSIIQFKNMGFYTTPVFFGTFSVILYETSNKIQFQYRLIVDNTSLRPRGNSATIGIENADGTAGVQYSYHQLDLISSGKAISFTPSGSTYTLNSDAVYDGVYLTRNISQPDPGITSLITPTQDAIIGNNYTFEWAPASSAASYNLYISNNFDLSGATVYPAGTNLTQAVTGLLLDTTYYWGVFATNPSGTTWCEIKRFYTSSAPPLAGVSRTLWVEQGEETLGTILYTGGDGSTVTATVTTLPAEGKLYQAVGGIKGDQITSVPALVTDPGLKLIYVADGAAGNGAGSFNFYVTDGDGDAPEETITINVSPPGIPVVLFVARSSGVEIQFDRNMNNPAGKEAQFTVTVNGSPVAVTAAGIKPGDSTTIVLTLATALTGSETVMVAYTQGDVTARTGGFLLSFDPATVTLLAQTITFPEITPKKYGDPDYTPGAGATGGPVTYSSSNLQVATIISNRVRFTGVGVAVITARQAGNATYAPAKYERSLTVNRGDPVITFNALPPKTYGDEPFNLTATISSGLTIAYSSSNSDVATISGNTVTIHNAGSTTITASQDGSPLWNPAPPVERALTVNIITLTVTADDKTKPYLEPIPELTYVITGFILGETSSVINELPTAVTTALQSSEAGTYPITAAGGSDNNYNFTYVAGTLTITPIEQIITFGELPPSVLLSTPLTLTATSTSGLTVLFESMNNAIATVAGDQLTGVAKGSVQVRGYNEGNINYLPGEAFYSVEVIITHKDILYLFTPNNDGFNDLWEIPNLDLAGRVEVRVFNRWGKQVFASSDYNNDWDGTSEGKPLPEGAYVFIINSENQGVMKGTVNIIR